MGPLTRSLKMISHYFKQPRFSNKILLRKRMKGEICSKRNETNTYILILRNPFYKKRHPCGKVNSIREAKQKCLEINKFSLSSASSNRIRAAASSSFIFRQIKENLAHTDTCKFAIKLRLFRP